MYQSVNGTDLLPATKLTRFGWYDGSENSWKYRFIPQKRLRSKMWFQEIKNRKSRISYFNSTYHAPTESLLQIMPKHNWSRYDRQNRTMKLQRFHSKWAITAYIVHFCLSILFIYKYFVQRFCPIERYCYFIKYFLRIRLEKSQESDELFTGNVFVRKILRYKNTETQWAMAFGSSIFNIIASLLK